MSVDSGRALRDDDDACDIIEAASLSCLSGVGGYLMDCDVIDVCELLCVSFVLPPELEGEMPESLVESTSTEETSFVCVPLASLRSSVATSDALGVAKLDGLETAFVSSSSARETWWRGSRRAEWIDPLGEEREMEAWSALSLSVSLSRKFGRVGEGEGDSLRTDMRKCAGRRGCGGRRKIQPGRDAFTSDRLN